MGGGGGGGVGGRGESRVGWEVVRLLLLFFLGGEWGGKGAVFDWEVGELTA